MTTNQTLADLQIKLVLIGESNVGKSSIVTRLIKNEFSDQYKCATVGAAFQTKHININNKRIRFECWDTAGQERYRSIVPMYYRNANVALIVYDISNRESFEKVTEWVKELKEKGPPNIMIIIVGNKLDLGENRQVEKSVAKEYADSNSFIFSEVSAKTGDNVMDLFCNIASKMLNNNNDKATSTYEQNPYYVKRVQKDYTIQDNIHTDSFISDDFNNDHKYDTLSKKFCCY